MTNKTEVCISVEDKNGNHLKSFLSITKSPISYPEIGYVANGDGNYPGYVTLKCVEGLYEFTAHSQDENKNPLKGKVQIDVQGSKLICVNIVVK